MNYIDPFDIIGAAIAVVIVFLVVIFSTPEVGPAFRAVLAYLGSM